MAGGGGQGTGQGNSGNSGADRGDKDHGFGAVGDAVGAIGAAIGRGLGTTGHTGRASTGRGMQDRGHAGPSGAGSDAAERRRRAEAARRANTPKVVKPRRDWRMSGFGGGPTTHITPGYREVIDKNGNVQRVPIGDGLGRPEFAVDSWGRSSPGGPAGGPAPVEAEDMNVHGRNSPAYQAAMDRIEGWRQSNVDRIGASYAPYQEIGKQAVARLAAAGEYKGKPLDLKDFDPNSVNVEEDPGYQFRMQEGLKAIRRGAAAGSGARGGATMKALTKYGQDMASTEYRAAYDRAVQRYGMERQNVMDERSAALQDWNLRFSNNLALAGMGMDAEGQNLASRLAINQHAFQREAHLDDTRLAERGLELDKYGIDQGVGQANRDRKAKERGDMFSNILGIAGLGISLFSDRRLKTDVRKVGETPGGVGVYKYKMRGSVKPRVGVMADEVEKKMPKAVSVDPQTGFKKVNYKKVK